MSEIALPIERSALSRYGQLAVLILAGGAIYPLIYLRQNFETSILTSFGITLTELNQCYSMLGAIFVLTYLPSGWLADKVSPRWLITFSLALTGLLGFWFSTLPSFQTLLFIFGGWGIATGLTFWAALIKGVALLAMHNEQGRFFGILEGGRGLFEAILATIVIMLFAHSLDTLGQSTSGALQQVIYVYVGVALVMSPLVFLTIDEFDDKEVSSTDADQPKRNLWADIKGLFSKPELWLAAFCLLCGYQLFWATYSFSGYLQTYGLAEVAVQPLTVATLWMRPIGPMVAGFMGDRFNLEKVLAGLFVAGSLALTILIILPPDTSSRSLLASVMFFGLLTYAIRGIYWSTFDSCDVPLRIKGLAIGVMSFIGYSPDIYLPMINAELQESFPGRMGYDIYHAGLVSMGLLGALSAWRLKVIISRRRIVGGA